MSDTRISGSFMHLDQDGLINDSNPQVYRDAYTVAKLAESVRSGNITSDFANKVCLALPPGSDLRGQYYLEERNIHILFNLVGGAAEIGVFREDNKSYKTVITDGDIDCPLNFSDCVWHNIVTNVHGVCNRVKVVYSDAKRIYRSIEITDPCCDKRPDKLESKVFKPKCIITPKITAIPGLGILEAGSYQVTLKAYDEEANTTNFAITTQHLKITEGDNIIGQETKFAILIEAFALPEDYTFVEIVIVETVGGDNRFKIISDVGVAGNTLKFTYTGREGAYVPSKVREIRDRIRHIFKGDGISEHMGRPVLHSTEPERNWNLQKIVNQVRWRYDRNAVPMDEAHHYATLRAGEFYIFGLSFNFKDSRRTKVFMGVNDNAVLAGTTEDCGCPVPNWFAQDTSVRLTLDSDPPESNNLRVQGKKHINEIFKVGSPTVETGQITTLENPNPEVDTTNNTEGCGCFDCATPFEKLTQKFFAGIFTTINYVLSKWVEFMLYFNVEIGAFTPLEIPVLEPSDCCELLKTCTTATVPEIYADANIKEEDTITTEIEKETLQSIKVINNDTREKKDHPDHKLIKSTFKTNLPNGTMRNNGQTSWVAKDGFWHYQNNSRIYEKYENVNMDPKNPPLSKNKVYNGLNLTGFGAGDEREGDCVPTRTKPIHYSSGKFGYGESEQLYPETIGRDDCEPMHGSYAGKPINFFRAPSLTKEPHWFGGGDNVPSHIGPTNNVIDDTWAILTGLKLENLNLPQELLDELCEEQPFTVYQALRDEANKSVLSTGGLHDTFRGPIAGVDHLHGKHAANSFEFYDPTISDGSNTFRRGEASDIPCYLMHSPDIMLYGNRNDAQFLWIDLELSGRGTRYGQFAEGTEDPGLFGEKINQAGTRAGINMSHHNTDAIGDTPKFKCIKAMEFAEFDGDVPANGKFTLPYNNKYRESGMLIELEGEKEPFSQDAIGAYGSRGFTSDGASDNSHIGDGIDHFSMIGNCRMFHATTLRYLPSQYGSATNMTFIPTGLHGTKVDFDKGQGISVTGMIGDSYVGSYAYKRTSVLSDKVFEDITPDTAFGLTNIFRGTVLNWIPGLASAFGSLVTKILRVIGWDDCGVIPPSGDSDHIINQYNLRPGMRALTDTEFSGANIGIPSNGEYGDVYFPSSLATWIHGIYTSDIVLKYRGTGTIDLKPTLGDPNDIAEVHPMRLKGVPLDATLPNGTDYRYAYMNRNGKKMIEPARIKLIGQSLLLAAWVYYIGFSILYLGVKIVADAVNSVTFGLANAIGGILVTILGVAIAAMGLIWIRHWANSDLDNKIAARLFGIKGCFPDIKNSNLDGTLQGSPYQMKLGKALYGFEDNYFAYNVDLVTQNRLETEFSPPKNYDTQWCPTEYSTKLILGNKQNPESHISSWKNFKPHNFLNIPRTRGAITKVLTVAGRMIVHTTETLIVVGVQDRIVDLVNDSQPLGRQSVFTNSQDLFSGVAAGYGGTKDPNAGFVDRTGYWFIDSDARRPMVFTGSTVTEQPFIGLEDFFDENLHFHILEHWPDFPIRDQKCSHGVHYDMSIDHNRSIFYLHKKDYKLGAGICYENKVFTGADKKVIHDIKDLKHWQANNFTLVYDLKQQRYITKQYWSPDLMFFNRNTMFAKKGDTIYDWTERRRFREFFGELFPMFIDIVIPTIDEKLDVLRVESVKLVGEVIQYNGDGSTQELREERLVDRIMLYNGHQSTVWIEPLDHNHLDDDDIRKDTDEVADGEAQWRNEINGGLITKINNVVPKGEGATTKYNPVIRTYETSFNKENNEEPILEDDYIGIKMIINKPANIQVVLRRILVNVDINKDQN